MSNLPLINKITRLARNFGTPIKSYDFVGKGIIFVYEVGEDEVRRQYPDADSGIRQEIERLERLSKIEI